jgi:hypothetical protein
MTQRVVDGVTAAVTRVVEARGAGREQNSALEARSFALGANFPWIDCGWDFGEPPPGWQRNPAQDWGRVERDLSELSLLGIKIVRWWVLAGGVNYPVGRAISEIAERVSVPLRGEHWQLKQGARLPRLSDAFLADFEQLCRAANNAGVQLMPSLLSFEWFDRIRPDSRGRSRLVFGKPHADYKAQIEAFLACTLDPLLEVSRSQARAIHAWETINEPDWVTHGGPLNLSVDKTVQDYQMDALLFSATRRIERAGFVATTGFKVARPSWLQPYLWDYLRELAESGRYVHQLHHYPTLLSERTLPLARQSPILPVLVAEFPTSDAWSLQNAPWADRGLSEHLPRLYLERRLELIRDSGYAGALLWATEPAWLQERRVKSGGPYTMDSRTLWSERQRAQVRNFSAERKYAWQAG